jgi:hypothetical protein
LLSKQCFVNDKNRIKTENFDFATNRTKIGTENRGAGIDSAIRCHGGAIAPRKDLPLLENAVNRIDKIATSLAGEIVSEVGVNPTTLDVTLRLNGGTLLSSQRLRAFILVLASPMSQVGRIPKDFGDATGVAVLPLFGDPQGVNSNDESVDIELVPQRGYFNREPLKIFKRDQGFSFEPSQDQRTRVIAVRRISHRSCWCLAQRNHRWRTPKHPWNSCYGRSFKRIRQRLNSHP